MCHATVTSRRARSSPAFQTSDEMFQTSLQDSQAESSFVMYIEVPTPAVCLSSLMWYQVLTSN